MTCIHQVRKGGKWVTELVLIDGAQISKVVELHYDSLKHILAILSSGAVDQNVVKCQELLYNPELRAALREASFWQTAASLELFVEAHMAYDAAGLTIPQRLGRLETQARVFRALLAGRMNHVAGEFGHAPPSDLASLASQPCAHPYVGSEGFFD